MRFFSDLDKLSDVMGMAVVGVVGDEKVIGSCSTAWTLPSKRMQHAVGNVSMTLVVGRSRV